MLPLFANAIFESKLEIFIYRVLSRFTFSANAFLRYRKH